MTYTESGLYEQTFTSAQGCDSIVILDLTLGASSYVSPIHGESLIYYQTNGQYTYSIILLIYLTSTMPAMPCTIWTVIPTQVSSAPKATAPFFLQHGPLTMTTDGIFPAQDSCDTSTRVLLKSTPRSCTSSSGVRCPCRPARRRNLPR